MKFKEHVQRHKESHQTFNELLDDFMLHTKKLPSKTTLMEFMEWSHSQIFNPSPDPSESD